jgi:hypothetical protein
MGRALLFTNGAMKPPGPSRTSLSNQQEKTKEKGGRKSGLNGGGHPTDNDSEVLFVDRHVTLLRWLHW